MLGIDAYAWQRKTLAHIEAGHPTALTACNGAGKTSTVFVSAALWCLFNWPRARVVVTSASWSQLRKQFFDVIRERRFHPLFRQQKPENNYLPIMFDFPPLTSQTTLQTVKTLAGMTRFVIADLTECDECASRALGHCPRPSVSCRPFVDQEVRA